MPSRETREWVCGGWSLVERKKPETEWPVREVRDNSQEGKVEIKKGESNAAPKLVSFKGYGSGPCYLFFLQFQYNPICRQLKLHSLMDAVNAYLVCYPLYNRDGESAEGRELFIELGKPG